MGVEDIDEFAVRSLRSWIDRLRVDAAIAIPVGTEIDEVAVGRPVGFVAVGMTIGDRDPLFFRRFPRRIAGARRRRAR